MLLATVCIDGLIPNSELGEGGPRYSEFMGAGVLGIQN